MLLSDNGTNGKTDLTTEDVTTLTDGTRIVPFAAAVTTEKPPPRRAVITKGGGRTQLTTTPVLGFSIYGDIGPDRIGIGDVDAKLTVVIETLETLDDVLSPTGTGTDPT